MELFKIFGTINLKDKGSDALDNFNKKGKKTQENLTKVNKAMLKTSAVITGAITVTAGAIYKLTSNAGDALDTIHKGSQKIGVSNKAYQELDYWASQNGISHAGMEQAVGRLQQRMGLARAGNEKYSGALEKLGVNMKDLEKGVVTTEDAFAQAIQTLSGMEDEQEKIALTTELFGTKLSRNLLPALNDSSLSLEDAKKKAEELGLVLSDEAVDAGANFSDTMDNLQRAMQAITTEIGVALMPLVEEFANYIMDNMPAIREAVNKFIKGLKSVINFLTDNWDMIKKVGGSLLILMTTMKVITVAITIFNTVAQLSALVMGVFGVSLGAVLWPIALVVAAIVGIIAVGKLLINNFDLIKDKLGVFANYVGGKFSQIGDFIKNPIKKSVDFVGKQIDRVKKFFSNLKIKFPKIKLPRFKLNGKFSLKDMTVPKLGIEWFAKGGVMTKPTLFGSSGNNMLGGGEAGTEGIVPLEGKHMMPMAEAIAQYLNDSKTSGNTVINKFEIAKMIVREEADIRKIAEGLEELTMQKNRLRGSTV